MELCLKLQSFSFPSSLPSVKDVRFVNVDLKSSNHRAKRSSIVVSALAETAVSIAIAATVVGTAATILVRRSSKAAEEAEASMKECEVCLGSGICPECKGEGFVLKKLSDASAEKARLTATNMATRYTAGLPKKWSYCTKCSSTRSCIACGGSGKTSI
ncbi:hypothetical protein CARUB_v10018166mg [Capsella rubella]|uniref:DUF7895 domain-containing protein n=1 Tax=Capsella rubella TaxID=81985 RepID=R0FRP7_9BRAS|nr:uncharacterized protein LOC17886343 [Capsella rubella]XP_023638348.1 uncharacterized protein LOC17886343 [Capsella rubella]EOA24876.1 hypothetical protein CARUB_v10018166mg [Capsella rubella]